MFSYLQKEYFKNAVHRWNIKTGATRSGKTYCDYFTIPRRILACRGSGLIVLIGNTQGTLTRNILDPMRSIWGEGLVGNPGSGDTVTLFGKKCYIIGAEKSTQVSKIQGAGIEYAYGDEITTWSEDMFTMLKSRLDKPNSRFDGTCNPDNPGHWFKKFLDSDADIFCQRYTIDDNPFLSPVFVRELKREYEGTVYYDRYIKGLWCSAEGAIYRRFADNPSSFMISQSSELLRNPAKIIIGVDFGGTKSGTSFVAAGISRNYDSVIALASERHMSELDSDRLGDLFCRFCEFIISKYGIPQAAYCDNAESVLIRSLKKEVCRAGLPVSVRPALKSPVNDRIRLLVRLMSQGRFFVTNDCESLSDALRTAIWNPRVSYDERLDNGTTDIDSLDAFEYCIERDAIRLIG